MGNVFKMALQVIVRLGKDEESDEKAFEKIDSMQEKSETIVIRFGGSGSSYINNRFR